MSLVVKAKIKEAAGNFNISNDFSDELDKKVKEMVEKACQRAEGNNRRTVMAKDL